MVDASRFAHARIASGLSVSELAMTASVPRSSVEAFERGRCELQTFRTALALAHALGVRLKDLLADEDELIQAEDAQTPLGARPAQLMVLLFSAQKRVSRAVICEILQWSGQELVSATSALSALLKHTGLVLRQTSGGLDLVAWTTAADREVLVRTTQHLKSRLGVSNQDAKILYRGICSMANGDPSGWIGQPPPDGRARFAGDGAASLAAAGLIVHDPQRLGWKLAEDVRFSLEVAADARREIEERWRRSRKRGYRDED